jgi:hypothetical protein
MCIQLILEVGRLNNPRHFHQNRIVGKHARCHWFCGRYRFSLENLLGRESRKPLAWTVQQPSRFLHQKVAQNRN